MNKLFFCTALLFCLLGGSVRPARAEAALTCGRFSEDALPAAEPRSANWPLQRLATINAAVRAQPHRVLFLGDSLVEHFEIGAGAGLWREYLSPRGVLDAGVSGDRTEHLLWRLDNGTLDGPPPRAIVLLIGTNDLSYHRSPEDTADGIRAVLLKLREKLPQARILLLGLWPRSAAPESPFRTQIATVNRLIASCADNRAIRYGEIGGALLEADGRLAAEIAADHLHPSTAGYTRLAPRLAALIDKLAGP
ncbi:MAG TPA: GDSL-type esterase/lipase family protein [Stellaceae bacterium]|nr:GDSL-type esterase/lipase family protein [Stellaceae bacterium]